MTTFDDYRTAPYKGASMGRQDRDGALKHALRRNAYAGLGLLGLLLCAVVATSLVTWHAADPSLSFATETSPRNAFGLAGAIISDLSFQGLGLASAFLIITPTVWFWRLVLMRPARLSRNRFLAWFAGLCLLAVACSSIPVPDGWPLPLSLGGMVGDAFLSVVSRFNPQLMQSWYAVLVGAGAALLGILVLLASMGLGLRDLSFKRKVYREPEEDMVETYDEEHEEDDWDDSDEEDYANEHDTAGTLDRKKGASGKRSSVFSVPLGALNHWYLSRQANKARKAKERQLARQAKSGKPSFFSRLLAEEDDGLDALTNRMEPRLDRSAQEGHRPQMPGPGLNMGYSGPEDFAPPSAVGYDDYEEEDDWSEDATQQGARAPVGIAPPELNRPSTQMGNRAETNEQAKPTGTPAREWSGKRAAHGQVRSGQPVHPSG